MGSGLDLAHDNLGGTILQKSWTGKSFDVVNILRRFFASSSFADNKFASIANCNKHYVRRPQQSV